MVLDKEIPLSLYLYVITTNILSLLNRKLKVSLASPTLSSWMILFFVRTNKNTYYNLKKLFKKYHAITRQKVNYFKSRIYFLKNCRIQTKMAIVEQLGI